jgi:hypothetical protein
MEPIKIGFTGNRNGLNSEQEEQITLLLNKYNNIIVSHGDCVGSDTDFHKLCINYKETHLDKTIMIHIYPPNNSSLRAFNQGDLLMEEKPYLERNLNIIKNSSILIACPIDKNKEELRSGTWSTIRQAKKQNVLTYIF